MSRKQRRRIPEEPKGTKVKDSLYEDVLRGLDRIQNRRDREIKSIDIKPKSKVNIFIIIAVIIVSSSIGIGMLLPNIPQNQNPSSDEPPENPSIDTLNLIFQDLDGADFNLFQYYGQHIIMDVMGTYCEPCAQQVEILKEFTNQYPHVVVISVSTEDLNHLSTYKSQNAITWKIVKDIYSAATRLQVTYIPTIIHFSPEYIEVHRNVGLTSKETISSWVT